MGILLVYDVTDEKSFNSEFSIFYCQEASYEEERRSEVHFRRLNWLTKFGADIRTWFSNVEQHATEGVKKILIGNKCDWEEKRAVSTERGQALADELGVPFLEVSAKSNINVEKAFYSLAADIKKKLSDTQAKEQAATGGAGGSGGVNVADSGSWNAGGGKCC